LAWFERSAALGPDPDDPSAFAHAQLRFAFVCLGQRRFDLAAPLIEAALERFRAVGDRAGEARAVSHRGMLAVFQGDAVAARPLYARALALARAAGDDDAVGRILNNLGDSHAYALEAGAARGYYEESLAVVRRLGDRQMTSNVWGSLGLVALELGDRTGAGAALAESASLVRALGITYSVPTALDQLGCLAAADGAGDRAARLWGAASGLRAALEVPEPAFTGAQLAPWRIRAHANVGAAAFEAAWTAGRKLPRADVLTLLDAELLGSPSLDR
jgi:tetratricopeptide (TPR) repeat protein